MTNAADMRDSPSSEAHEYDPRYLQGILFFNRSDYFDAHEIWEDLWRDCPATERRFYQSLIQAAVALYHGGNGNRSGAARLSDSGKRYMEPFRPRYRGLDVEGFWSQVFDALAPLLNGTTTTPPAPRIVLDPDPQTWPDEDTEVRHE